MRTPSWGAVSNRQSGSYPGIWRVFCRFCQMNLRWFISILVRVATSSPSASGPVMLTQFTPFTGVLPPSRRGFGRPAAALSTRSRFPTRLTSPMLWARCSKAAPALANMSPSPVASTTTLARIACRPGLALEHRPAHGVAVEDRLHPETVQENVDLRLLDHLHHQVLHRLGIDGGIRSRSPVDDRPGHLVEPLHHLLADPLADLFAALHDVTEDQQHQPARPQPAHVAVALDQGHLGAGPAGRDRRRHPGRTTPDHQHVGLAEHRKLPLRVASPCRR